MSRTATPVQDPLPLLTARTRLRRLAATDLSRFQGYRHDPEVARWQGWTAQDDEAAAGFLQEMAGSSFCPEGQWFQMAIADRASDTLIGDIGVQLHGSAVQVAEIGFSLCAAAQGLGLAREAVGAITRWMLTQPSLQRVVAVADVRNTASLRLLDRLGFRAYADLPAQFRDQPCVERHCVLHKAGLPPVSLRPAHADEAAVVADLMRVSRRVLLPFAPSTHSDEDQARWVADTLLPAGGVTVAERAGRVVGMRALDLAGPGAAGDDPAHWLQQLYVHPAACASGVGAALLADALARCAQARPERPLRLWTFQANRHARAFYERHGFAAIHFTDGAANEERCPDVLYEHA